MPSYCRSRCIYLRNGAFTFARYDYNYSHNLHLWNPLNHLIKSRLKLFKLLPLAMSLCIGNKAFYSLEFFYVFVSFLLQCHFGSFVNGQRGWRPSPPSTSPPTSAAADCSFAVFAAAAASLDGDQALPRRQIGIERKLPLMTSEWRSFAPKISTSEAGKMMNQSSSTSFKSSKWFLRTEMTPSLHSLPISAESALRSTQRKSASACLSKGISNFSELLRIDWP